MKKIIITIVIAAATVAATAQSGYDAILQEIEANNTTLAALRKQVEAQKLANRTGITPANPEVEFNYLWGSPSAIGNRTDFSIKQSFDFPTVYAHRNTIANLQNENAERSYQIERQKLLLSAQQACIELVYYNTLRKEYELRLQNAERIAEAYKSKLGKGETTILEYNKAQLNLTTLQAEITGLESQCTVLRAELRRLNGGKELSILNSQFSITKLSVNFEDWYATAESKNPLLQYMSGQIEIGKQEVKLNQAMSFPKFSAGYMSEKVVGQHFQGITVGMSIPLWENKNQVKQAKAQTQATETILKDSKVQFYNNLQTLYAKAIALQQSAQKLRQSFNDNNNEPFLKKAFDAGEISLLTYLQETEFYYNTVDKTLEAERDFELAVAELQSYTHW
ncbi:MAG: TolC family protein [Bacteroidales bacterium]|jgi:outer membrane protein TolC|nr:TolC family protein [Bacteroidales bacterium]